MMIKDGKGRIALRYDLRDHSKLPAHLAEPTSDSTHTQKALPLFMHALMLGLIPQEYTDGIIKQLQQVTYQGNGNMAILMDGTSKHGGPKGDDYHPDSAHLADAMLLPGGDALKRIAREVFDAEYYSSPVSNHKAFHYAARLALVESGLLEDGEPSNLSGVKVPPPGNEPPVLDEAEDKPAKKDKDKRKKKDKHNKPLSKTAPGESASKYRLTQTVYIGGTGRAKNIPGSMGASIEHMGDPANGDDPGVVSCTNTYPALELTGLRRGKTHVKWGKGPIKCITPVVVL